MSKLAHLGLTGTASLAEDLDSALSSRSGCRGPNAMLAPSCLSRVLSRFCMPHSAERMMIELRDGRKIMGMMRSFDQFSNVVLESAVERVVHSGRYADVPLGLYVIRGENIVLLGEIVRASPLSAVPAP